MHEGRPSRLLVLLLATGWLGVTACAGPAPAQRKTGTPDADRIAAALEEYSDVVPDFDELRAVVVATGEEIVFERYVGTDQDTGWDMHSVTKSVVSTLVGIAVGEGLIGSLDDTLEQLLPEYAGAMSPVVAGTTLRQLLTMTAGFPEGDAFIRSADWVDEILSTPQSPPGGRFRYSNGTSHLLAAVVKQASGTSVLEFARSRLFGPLGIDTRPAFRPVATPEPTAKDVAAYQAADFAWPVDPQGVGTGWWGLKLRPRDMVRLGQLFLADGRRGGRQIVPADWVEQATTRQVPTDGVVDGYGFQWWTGTADGDRAFWAMGYGGQLIEVVPDRDLVVVTATEVRPGDPTSHGIGLDSLVTVIDDAVVSRFPDR